MTLGELNARLCNDTGASSGVIGKEGESTTFPNRERLKTFAWRITIFIIKKIISELDIFYEHCILVWNWVAY